MTWPHPSTHPTTHLLTKPHTHSWVGNSLQISNLQTELKYLDKLKCYQILSDSGGPPPSGDGGWMDGGGDGYGCVCGGVPCRHVCTCMHARMHMHVKHVVNMINMDASMSAAICNFYTCINVYVCACACMCMWGDTPHAPRCPPPTCPLPRATGSPKHQNSISPELIEIIWFCLKILYLWTFLNSYRL